MNQTDVAHLGLVEVQPVEFGQAVEMDQARVRHLGVFEAQVLNFLKTLEMNQSCVRHLGGNEVQSAVSIVSAEVLQGLHCLGSCLLYTSDAADERSSVDLGGRR